MYNKLDFKMTQKLIDHQQIVNYELAILENRPSLIQPMMGKNQKYGLWQLNKKIKDTIGERQHKIRWIGNKQTAYLEAYAYILLIGSLNSQVNIIQLKHNLYKISKKCLELSEQKLLVEFLCLIQYSRDRYSFLNKYPQIQSIFIKMLEYLEEQHTSSDESLPQNKNKIKIRKRNQAKNKKNSIYTHKSDYSLSHIQYEKDLQQIYEVFNACFEFIAIEDFTEYSCALKLFNSYTVYIIVQKICYFMIELVPQNQKALGQKNIQSLQLDVNNLFDNIEAQQYSSSRNHIDKAEFFKIFDFKSQVEESCVVAVERASQIKWPTFQSNNTPNFNRKSGQKHKIQTVKQFSPTKNQNDKSFIDQLINNQNLKQIGQKQAQNTKTGHKTKQKISEKHITIQNIKQELKNVRKRIQQKLKLMDINQKKKMNGLKSKNQNFTFHQPQNIVKNLIKQSIMKRQQMQEYAKKQRKTSYNSVDLYKKSYLSKNNTKNQQNQEQVISNINKTFQRNQKVNVHKILSQKAISRPHSYYNSFSQLQNKKSKGLRKIYPKTIFDRNKINMAMCNPNNLNVNVNVNISQNIINSISPHQNPLKYKNSNKTIDQISSFRTLPSISTHLYLPQPQKKYCHGNLKSPYSIIYEMAKPRSSINHDQNQQMKNIKFYYKK